MVFMVLLILLAAFVFYAIATFNTLTRFKNLVLEAWSSIDVQLKRRSDLIPNLVATVKGYATHEKQTLEEVVRLRNLSMSARTIDEKSQVETALAAQLKSVFALAEAYPDLKANQNFLHLQKDLSEIEDHIQLARRYYNGVTREYNTRISTFPAVLFSSMFGFRHQPYFELQQSERENPTIRF